MAAETYTISKFVVGPTTGRTVLPDPSTAVFSSTVTRFRATAQITVLPGCDSQLMAGKEINPNADVAGLGVILSFVITAYLAVLWAGLGYGFGFLPPSLLSAADRRVFFANSRRFNSKMSKALEEATIIFSDQQIITGIGILAAGFANFWPSQTEHPLAVYHWHILTYLAWMSSNVHLTTLSLLRNRLQRSKVFLVLRITGMLVLLILLIAALVPTVGGNWFWIMWPTFSEVNLTHSGLGVSAHCLWDTLARWQYIAPYNVNAVCSYVILILSYTWKLSQLRAGSRRSLRQWLRSTPEWLLERLALQILGPAEDVNRSFRRRVLFRVVAVIYLPFVALFEFLESFLASLWLLTLGLVWGSLQIFLTRRDVGDDILVKESRWGFGQILPVMLLLQPAAAVVNLLYCVPRELNDKDDHVEDPNSRRLPGIGSPLNFTYDPEKGQSDSLSSVFLAYGIRRPSAKAQEPRLEPQFEFLYSTRFFKSLLVLIQLLMLALSIVCFTMPAVGNWNSPPFLPSKRPEVTSWVLKFYGSPTDNFVASLAWGSGIMAVYVLIGSAFSRAFR